MRDTVPALLALAALACAPAHAPLPAPRPLGSDLPAISPRSVRSDPGRAAPPAAEPTGPVTLRDAVAASLLASPRLEAFSWAVRAEEARALQAGLLPNPSVVVDGENFGGTGDFGGYDVAETTVTLSQIVELGGKRAKRAAVVSRSRELAGWDYEAARLDVLTSATHRFVSVLAAQERAAIAADLERIAEEGVRDARERVRAGATDAIEITRAQVDLATRRVEVARSQDELDAARRALALSWRGTEPRFSLARGALDRIAPVPSLDALAARLAQNPDLARWAAATAQRDAQIALEDAARIPDVSAGFGVRRLEEPNDTALVFGLEIPIPIFDRNQGGRRAARADARRARAEERAARIALMRALTGTHARASSAYRRATGLRDDVLGLADRAHRSIREGYQKGRFSYTDVLQAELTLIEARGEYVAALEHYHAAKADLERLIGDSIESPALEDEAR